MNITIWQLPGMIKKNSSEYAGPCPECGGNDRFVVWPDKGRFWCRQCDKHGDLIDFLQWQRGMTYAQACQAAGRNDDPIPRIKLDMTWSEPVTKVDGELSPQTPTPPKTYPLEKWEIDILNQPPHFDCQGCDANVKGWCTASPRNQFVNVKFIDQCPKQMQKAA